MMRLPSNVSRDAVRALFAAQLGWMLDAMDFLLFVFALRAIQRDLHFADSTMGLLTTVALVSSAIGGVLFGRLADRIGRVKAMTWSMLLYSFATAALATSHSLAALLFWRTLVGFGMGGEWSSGSVLVAETWPAEHRGKAIGFMQSGWAIGAIIAAALAALVLEPFGWRVLFLAGAFPAVVALIIRRTVPEPAIWIARNAIRDKNERSPFAVMFSREYVSRTVIATLLASAVLVAFWGIMSWLPAFLATPVEKGGAGLTLTKSALWTILIQVGAFLGYVTFGFIADRIGRRPAFTAFMIGAAIVVPVYALSASRVAVLIAIGPLVGYFAHGYFSVFGALLAELFPTSIRATAQGFCYNGGRLASAAAPFLIGVAATTSGLGVALAVTASFFVVAAAIVWFLPETRGAELVA